MRRNSGNLRSLKCSRAPEPPEGPPSAKACTILPASARDDRLRELVQKRCCEHFFCCRRQSGASDETDAFQSQESNRVAELNRDSVSQHRNDALLIRVEISP